MKFLEIPVQTLEQEIHMAVEQNPALSLAKPQGEFSLDEARERHEAGLHPHEGRGRGAAGTETDESGFFSDDGSSDEFFRDGDSGDGGDSHYGPSTAAEDPEAERRRQFFFDSRTEPETLDEHLLAQYRTLELPPARAALALQIIGSLLPSGYLATPLAEIAQALNAELSDAEAALAAVQAFDPPGIAARNLSECLLLQLVADGRGDTLAADILREAPKSEIESRAFRALAARFGVTVSEVEFAFRDLAELDPAPGGAFGVTDMPAFVPEASVVERDGRFVVEEAESILPELLIDAEYEAYARHPGATPEFKSAVRQNVSAARDLRGFIENRRRTLLLIASKIVGRQQAFFRDGVVALAPLTQRDIAAEIGYSEPTVSRAVANKYMRTPRGTLPFSFFFSAHTGTLASGTGEAVSNKAVQEKLRGYIDDEDPAAPLSDNALAARLQSDIGVKIARTTVVKYRKQMGIPSCSERKQA